MVLNNDIIGSDVSGNGRSITNVLRVLSPGPDDSTQRELARYTKMIAERYVPLRWMRVPGDILFSIGAALFAWFVLGLLTGHSYSKKVQGGTDVSLHDGNEERTVALAGR